MWLYCLRQTHARVYEVSAFLSELPQVAQSQIVSVQVHGPRENADDVKHSSGSKLGGGDGEDDDEQMFWIVSGDVRQLSGAWTQVRQRRLYRPLSVFAEGGFMVQFCAYVSG